MASRSGFFEHRNVRHITQPSVLALDIEHALERGERTVDASVAQSPALLVRDELANHFRRNLAGLVALEKRIEPHNLVQTRLPFRVESQRLPGVSLVVGIIGLSQIFVPEPRSIRVDARDSLPSAQPKFLRGLLRVVRFGRDTDALAANEILQPKILRAWTREDISSTTFSLSVFRAGARRRESSKRRQLPEERAVCGV
jgi:hypothetical protein